MLEHELLPPWISSKPQQRRVLVGKWPHGGVHGIPVGSAGVGRGLTRSLALFLLVNKIGRQRLRGGGQGAGVGLGLRDQRNIEREVNWPFSGLSTRGGH